MKMATLRSNSRKVFPFKDSWQRIIWREWRHCHDAEYARHLFALVAEEPVGFGSRLTLLLGNATAGAALAVLAGFVFTSSWSVLQHLFWLGGLLGIIRGYVIGRDLTWQSWLDRLSSNSPTGSFSRLIFGLISLGLIGGMIFGPLFWLVGAGLFWTVGELITWINRGMTTKPQDNLQERRWWFWWHKRPHLLEVESALQTACILSPATGATWRVPLSKLADDAPVTTPVDVLIRQLLSQDWIERFVARHALIRLGETAAFPLQNTWNGSDTPFQRTVHWLMHNITDPKMKN